jgi:ubiquinone biosynthesis protein
VLPGSRIVMLDFGACGVTSHEHRVLGLEVFRRVVNEDITGTANATIGLLTPLPYVDVPEMRSRFERLFFNFFQGSFTKGSDWWERTTATIWLQMVAITREFDLTLPLEMLRMIRATLLFDTLACRLEPDNNLRSVFGYWMRDANKRAARRRRKRLEKPGLDRTLTTELLSRLGESEDLLAKTSVVANLYARRASIEFMPLSGKSAYVASAVLRFALRTLWLGLWVGLILVAYNAASGRNAGPWDVALGVAQNPGVLFVFAVMLVIGTRRVVQRLSDPEAP